MKTLQDGRGNTSTFNYDPTYSNLLSVQKPVVGGLTPQVSYTYNARGQVLTSTDETSIVTQYNYDTSTEKLLSIVVDYGTSPHLNLTTSFGYNSVGDVTSVTDPNTNQSTYLFDSERRQTQQMTPSPFNYVTQLAYDSNDNLTSKQRQIGGSPNWQTYNMAYFANNKLQSVTDPLGYVTAFNYDNMNRPWQATDAQSRTTKDAYDPVTGSRL